MVQSNHVDEKDGIWSFELSREEGTLRVIVLILTELGTVVKISSMPPHHHPCIFIFTAPPVVI
jgi:hypothetical protein